MQRQRFRRPVVDMFCRSVQLRCLRRTRLVQTAARQTDDLAGSGVTVPKGCVTVPEGCVRAGRPQRDDLTAMAELDRRWHHDLRRPRKRNHFRLRRQLQGTLCIGTGRELVIERLVRDRRIREHRVMPCLRLHQAGQQSADAVAERVVRVKLDEFLIVLDGILGQYVIIGLARGSRREIVRRLDGFLLYRSSVCCNRGIAKEIEIAGQRRTFPGGLLPTG